MNCCLQVQPVDLWMSDRNMIIVSVRHLSAGVECSISINDQEKVLALKSLVSERLHIPVDQQRLVLNGASLMDSGSLVSQNVRNGSKLHLIVKKPVEVPVETDFQREMKLFLRPHFTDPDAKVIISTMQKAIEMRLTNDVSLLSLDDIERLATAKLAQPGDV